MRNIKNKDIWAAFTSSEKDQLATECGTNKNYLSQVANGTRLASPSLCNKIHFFTRGEWSRKSLNPSIFNDPLPEGRLEGIPLKGEKKTKRVMFALEESLYERLLTLTKLKNTTKSKIAYDALSEQILKTTRTTHPKEMNI